MKSGVKLQSEVENPAAVEDTRGRRERSEAALVPLKLQLAFRWLVHWRLLAVSLAFAGSQVQKDFKRTNSLKIYENRKPMNIELVNAETFKDQGCFV